MILWFNVCIAVGAFYVDLFRVRFVSSRTVFWSRAANVGIIGLEASTLPCQRVAQLAERCQAPRRSVGREVAGGPLASVWRPMLSQSRSRIAARTSARGSGRIREHMVS